MAAPLNSEETRHKAINILRTLIDRIVLHPGKGRGEMAIELHGDLAAILAFTRNATAQCLATRPPASSPYCSTSSLAERQMSMSWGVAAPNQSSEYFIGFAYINQFGEYQSLRTSSAAWSQDCQDTVFTQNAEQIGNGLPTRLLIAG